jgi:ectoine hydroxylase-related dioxygenase (phytanoyl-CoA dioxygenase family)
MKQFDYPKFTLDTKLTDEQKDFYDRFGFLHFENFYSHEVVNEIIGELVKIQDKWIAENVVKSYGIPVKYGVDDKGNRIVQRYAFTSCYSDYLHELLKDKRFRALFELLPKPARIGELEKDGMVANQYFNTDTTGNYNKLGWHTDCLRDVFYVKKIQPMLNVGISLDNSDADKGGLRLIPGTHNQNLYDLMFRKKYFMDNTEDPEEVAVYTKPGDVTIHDGRIWHRVALSPHKGLASRRRVIYFPIISGKYKPKTNKSWTPIYHKLWKIK